MTTESVIIEFLVKVRDAVDQALDQLTPPDVKIEKPTEQQFHCLSWKQIQSKNPYEQTTNNNSKEFRILQNWLSENQGFAQLFDFKCWFHMNDENIIDRRRV